MKYLLIAVLVLSPLGVSLDAVAEQKILFCSEGYRSTESFAESRCLTACTIDCDLKGLLSNGWKIDTNMPKRITPPSNDVLELMYCECTGTQYVLSKSDNKEAGDTNINVELLKKEIELLKKENGMLQKENDALKTKGKNKKK
ncbi:MAG: hypothetical protein H7Y05_01585 [Steroidobacteraceae bacterium]|nr:hypothetical protein [Deltaproteobacteria bacterium]